MNIFFVCVISSLRTQIHSLNTNSKKKNTTLYLKDICYIMPHLVLFYNLFNTTIC